MTAVRRQRGADRMPRRTMMANRTTARRTTARQLTGRRLPEVAAAPIVLAVVVLLAGCGGGSVTLDPGSGTSGGDVTTTPSATPGDTELTIVIDGGDGTTTRWQLTCDPDGGDHPTPAAACAALAAKGATALPAVPAGVMCSQIFGGPQKARITGTWRGRTVDASLSRANGCEVARWDALAGLLPKESIGG